MTVVRHANGEPSLAVQVKAAANAVRKSYTRSGPQGNSGDAAAASPEDMPDAETILKVLSALATQGQR